jgi:hypothetical protein
MEVSIEMQIEWHLLGTENPPAPKAMVKPCIAAIMSYNAGDRIKLIALPEGITYQGKPEIPAVALINAHHLEDWLVEEDEWI